MEREELDKRDDGIMDPVEGEKEVSSWETLTEDDERYIEEMERKESEEESIERPRIDVEVANMAAEQEKKDMGPELGMKFHSFWVSFGLPLVLMWAGLDAFMAIFALIQGNVGAIANILIRGAVVFFGIPAFKGLKKFTRISFLKHTTLCFYSCAVKVVNLVMVVLNVAAAPDYVASLFAERSEEFIAQGITEAMLLDQLHMQFALNALLNVVTLVFWILIYVYYRKRKKYFTYK